MTFAHAARPALHWERAADLPDPVGLKGAYAGVHAGWVIVAGGSNFPVPQRQGGKKTFARAAYLRPVAGALTEPWRVLPDALPAGLAEGAAVTTEFGVVGVGGQSSAGPVAEVFLLTVSPDGGAVGRRPLPALPEPLATVAVAYRQGHLYAAGGESQGQGRAWFARLDLRAALAGDRTGTWEPLPAWPGPPRFGAVLEALEFSGKTELVLAGGRSRATAPAREEDYLRDAYRFDPATAAWTRLPDLPHRSLLGAALRLSATRLLVLGGSDAHDLARMAELGERYRLPDHVQVLDALRGDWQVAGAMPLGAVGVAVVALPGGWLVAGGEWSPGLRTAQVHFLHAPASP